MAEIRPLRAWRYNRELSVDIESLTSPLFDVVSQRQRESLYHNPFNSIHLSVPAAEDSSSAVKNTIEAWKANGHIVQDLVPGIYAYYQYFSLRGSTKEYCRKGFVCFIKATDWKENIILRHENTMPYSVNDRKEILEASQLNVSPTHGLYTDPDHQIEEWLDESMTNPIYETEDYQGVRDKLSVIHDVDTINKIIGVLKDKQVILADGHHRYEGSMLYRNEKMKSPDYDPDAGYNYHMMYLTNTESDDLRILPTHRLINGIEGLEEGQLLKALEDDFIIKTIENVNDIPDIILGKKWAFGLIINDNCYKIRLKPEKMETMTWKFPDAIKELDLTILHYFIFEKILKIPGKDQRSSKHISFERNFTACHTKVIKGESQFAVITKDIPIETVKQVCHSGYTLPQKSTYFYPKAICGFLFGSIKEDEFKSPADSCFQ